MVTRGHPYSAEQDPKLCAITVWNKQCGAGRSEGRHGRLPNALRCGTVLRFRFGLPVDWVRLLRALPRRPGHCGILPCLFQAVAPGGYAAALTLGCVMGRFQRPAAGSPSGTKTGHETTADRRRFCSAQKFGKSSRPKVQPFIQRRAKPWYRGPTACCSLLCPAVFGPTGQKFASLPIPGRRPCHNPLRESGCTTPSEPRDGADTVRMMNSWPVGPNVTENKKPLYQGFALRWGNWCPFGAHIRRCR